MSETPLVLHIWPPKWNLQSLDPTCLAAVMYLQLTIPGKFKVALCSNPDKSPSGYLPFFTHGHVVISTFPSIVAFVASLAKSGAFGAIDLDASLAGSQKATKVALYAHVESHVSDLVSHMFYGNDTNFSRLTNPTLASEMPVPQKYYVASRIREAYRPRLEVAGLWSLPTADAEPKGLFETDKKKNRDYMVTFSHAFEREKILDKAKTILGVHVSHLDGKQFFFGNRPTSLDVYLAAHILLLADPPFPDAVLQVQLSEHCQGLIDHARRIQAQVARAPPCERFAASKTSLSSLIPRLPGHSRAQTQVDPADVQHIRRTLILLMGALAAAVTCVAVQASFIVVTSAEDSEDESEDSGGGKEEEELARGSGVFTDGEED